MMYTDVVGNIIAMACGLASIATTSAAVALATAADM